MPNEMKASVVENPDKRKWRLDRLIYLPVVGLLFAAWGLTVNFALVERTNTIERATTQLGITVSTLADFSELADHTNAATADETKTAREDAIWRALLQYPTANIWVEKNGILTDGQPSPAGQGQNIFVQESRGITVVHAAFPEQDALAEWRSTTWWRGGILSATTFVFLVLTYFLNKGLRQRAIAEHQVVLAHERTAQLAAFQTELQQTVTSRTDELHRSNQLLEKELIERTAAENRLREHDSLLHAVTQSASELLGSHSYDDAIAIVLELIARTVTVGRVQLNSLSPDGDGHLRLTVMSEWCAPGSVSTLGNPGFENLDLASHFPKKIMQLLAGEAFSFSVTEIPEQHRPLFEKANMKSFLEIPVMVSSKLWGLITFVDSSRTDREWTWAEMDVLKTLGGLIGVAIVRARFVKELADANMIVQNSPTILYRLRAEPSFPLVYISQNISKFGHDPTQLIEALNWAETLIESDDRAKVGAAMTHLLEKGAQGASIEFRMRKGDGGTRWVEDRYIPVRDKFGRLTEIEGMIIDVTERKVAEEKIALLARTDSLTGLANRATFTERLRQTFAATKRGGPAFAIFYLDIDHFKIVNDTLGHPMGDALLIRVAERLKDATRDTDLVARLGGDEFAVLQMDMVDPASAGDLAGKILRALAAPFLLDENKISVSASIGICPYISGSLSPDGMLKQADLALYRAKEQGRNQYRFHSEDLDQEVLERVVLADELRNGLERNEFELFYQPQVDVISGKVVGLEALVRWHHPTRGLLKPASFLAIAEQTGAIVALGHWVFDQAAQQMKHWRDEGNSPDTMTVNLSLAQLKNSREIVQDVVKTVEKWGLVPSDFEFDVTEATIALLTWAQNDVLSQLCRLGAKIAIDNFGTEYSSFEYLRSYGVNHLKIARSLVATAIDNPERTAMIRAMVNMARDLGIGVIAEGVETEAQRALFSTPGSSTHAQGYYFSEPVEASRAREFLVKGYINPIVTAKKAATFALLPRKVIAG